MFSFSHIFLATEADSLLPSIAAMKWSMTFDRAKGGWKETSGLKGDIGGSEAEFNPLKLG